MRNINGYSRQVNGMNAGCVFPDIARFALLVHLVPGGLFLQSHHDAW
jgi:hypothetical protein